jgi:carbohydrate-selective porin OprB
MHRDAQTYSSKVLMGNWMEETRLEAVSRVVGRARYRSESLKRVKGGTDNVIVEVASNMQR